MCPNLRFRSAVMDFVVAVDNVVIPDSYELPLLIPTSDVSDGEVFSFRRSRAVYNVLVISLMSSSPPFRPPCPGYPIVPEWS